MLYVKRNDSGDIVSISAEKTSDISEAVDAKSPELFNFLLKNSSEDTAHAFLSSTDNDLIRILEDLISLLMDKNLISLTDLPVPAQKKLLNRKQLRNQVQNTGTMLVEDNDLF